MIIIFCLLLRMLLNDVLSTKLYVKNKFITGKHLTNNKNTVKI